MSKLLKSHEYRGNIPYSGVGVPVLPWICDRRFGLKAPPSRDPRRSSWDVHTRFYCHVKPSLYSYLNAQHGSIFNLEFSPDGKTLAVAYEMRTIAISDPCTERWVHNVPEAHSEAINFIRFIDDRLFASCSDDMLVKLWDLRMLGKPFAKLRGHSHWVKNVEFLPESSTLLTSAFDRQILAWDINTYHEECEGPKPRKLMSVDLLCRMAVSNSSPRQLVLTLTEDYVVIVHNLQLSSLCNKTISEEDLEASAVREVLGSMTDIAIEDERCPSAAGSANEIEIVSSLYPEPCGGWAISSVAVHPHSWCVVVRYNRPFEFITQGVTRLSEYEFCSVLDLHPRGSEGGEKPPSRLLHFTTETNTDPDFIKEVSFSPDGRIICSPFGFGIRLLAFNPSLGEMCDERPEKPSTLFELKTLVTHDRAVVVGKFSPTQFILATGCLHGQLVYHRPFAS